MNPYTNTTKTQFQKKNGTRYKKLVSNPQPHKMVINSDYYDIYCTFYCNIGPKPKPLIDNETMIAIRPVLKFRTIKFNNSWHYPKSIQPPDVYWVKTCLDTNAPASIYKQIKNRLIKDKLGHELNKHCPQCGGRVLPLKHEQLLNTIFKMGGPEATLEYLYSIGATKGTE